MIDRQAYAELLVWKSRPSRKPLIIRGARQVGKSHLVRRFGNAEFTHLLEVNLENDPAVAEFFERTDLRSGLQLLSAYLGQPIIPGETLLFLDEIQAAPHLLARLRYLYEQIPELHVAAAGSLLDFVLDKHSFSMPVGRVEYLHLGPLHFSEYLTAIGKTALWAYIADFSPGRDEMPVAIHRQLMECLQAFLICGGMPESTERSIGSEASFVEAARARSSILDTMEDDFAKYGARIDTAPLRACFRSLPRLVGQQLKYVMISRDYRAAQLSESLRLLQLARIGYLVHRTAANGLPLAAEQDEKRFKPLFLDVGLMLHALGLSVTDLSVANLMFANSGAVAEQFVGQHLLYRQPPYRTPELHYWAREKGGTAAELDYVIANGSTVLPVEVKAGKSGSLRSLNYFMVHHQAPCAVRLNTDPPSLTQSQGHLPTGEAYAFPLLSLPLYMVERLPDIV